MAQTGALSCTLSGRWSSCPKIRKPSRPARKEKTRTALMTTMRTRIERRAAGSSISSATGAGSRPGTNHHFCDEGCWYYIEMLCLGTDVSRQTPGHLHRDLFAAYARPSSACHVQQPPSKTTLNTVYLRKGSPTERSLLTSTPARKQNWYACGRGCPPASTSS